MTSLRLSQNFKLFFFSLKKRSQKKTENLSLDVITWIGLYNSRTLSQALRNIYYNIAGDDSSIISAASSGTVSINGATGTT